MTHAPRKLIVNADDFGFTADVNQGIIEAHSRGILSATTLMANGSAFDHAVALAFQTPTLDVGCHLVLVQGPSVSDPKRMLPLSVADLIRQMVRRRISVYEELSAQVSRIISAGIKPTHLDTHKHTHLLPPVLEAVARVSQQFGIRWVRRPFDLPMPDPPCPVPWITRAASRAFAPWAGHFERVLQRNGCRSTDHFTGFEITGRFGTAELGKVIRNLPPGITEFMCHPGRCGAELMQASTRLKQSRAKELEALIAPDTKAALEEAGVELVRYRHL